MATVWQEREMSEANRLIKLEERYAGKTENH